LFSVILFFCGDNACTHEWSTDHFSECVERHAYSTYDEYLKLHEGKAALMGLIVEPGLVFFYPCKAVSQTANESQTVLILCHHVSRFSVSSSYEHPKP
jgi:hypothetical protein